MEPKGDLVMTREEAIKALRLERDIEINGNAVWVAEFLQGLDVALSALRPVSREQVEKVWKGCALCNWGGLDCVGIDSDGVYLSKPPEDERFRFCPVCGKPLTDEAVEMVMERLEALKDGDLE